MRTVALLPILACLSTVAWGKVFSRCELARLLQRGGLDGFMGYSLDNWICLAFYGSRFDTGTVTENSDGSSDYGIFQINSRRWCTDHHSHTLDLCQTRCLDLLTADLIDDINCVKKVVMDWEGMGAWYGENHLISGRDLSHWLASCNL
uniref:Sperm acrosome membrane-associated protein 3 n=1 Tax=Pelusios castaneus TaxID=367368 RepID=A0A8C8RT50_9SAUR